jgi:hypothetical protein
VKRETLDDGTIRVSEGGIAATLQRLRPGAYLVAYKGYDDGSLSDTVLDVLGSELGREGFLHVYIDAGDTDGVTTTVRETWTRWMQRHRDRTRLTLLVHSKFMQVTLNVAKHLAGFGKMTLLADRDRFDKAVEAARRGDAGSGQS